MKFDQILVYLGEFGKYQKIMYFLVCLATIPCAFHSLGNTFLSASPDHQCLYYKDQNFTKNDDQAKCLYPPEGKKTTTWSKCEKYANLSIEGPDDYTCTEDDILGYEPVKCDQGWSYDTEFYESTAVTEWNLVCENNWMKQLSKSIVLVGKLVGSIFFGQLSDITGRKIGLMISILIMALGSISTIFAPTFWAYCISQFFVGTSASGVFVIAFVMGTELVGSSWRAFTGMTIQYFYSIGYMLLAVISNGLRDWRQIEMVFCAFGLTYLSYYWLLPESPRWLLARGSTDEAEKIIRKAATVNKVILPPDLFQKDIEAKEDDTTVEDKVDKSHSFLDLFRTPAIRMRTVNLYFNWFTNSMMYYGLSFQTASLGSSPYLSFFYAGLVEIPSYMFAQLVLGRIGRKALLCGYMVAGGIALFGTIPVSEENETLLLVLVLFGKMCASGSFAVVYLFTAELYPTPIRNVGVGSCSMSSRVGGILAPYVLLIGEVSSIAVPMTFFGIISVVAGLLILFLPETTDCQLPETIEESEKFRGTRKSKNENSIDETKGEDNEGFNKEEYESHRESTAL